MNAFLHHVAVSAPIFAVIFFGYAIMKLTRWPKSMAENIMSFVFVVALPVMLFRLMTGLSRLPPMDWRLLIAFFGGCLLVYGLGRWIALRVFGLDGVGQSVFALGGIFSNNLMLGLPLAKFALGDGALPSVALVLVFNSFFLWTLVTISVEWTLHGSLSMRGLLKTFKAVLTNPIVVGILAGSVIGLSNTRLPSVVDESLAMIAQAGSPLALIGLGMGLAEYGAFRDRKTFHLSLGISAVKLILQPLVVLLLAWLLKLPLMETEVVVLLASMAVGANVYLMARQFAALEGAIASCIVISTCVAALTTPVMLALAKLLV